MIVGYARCPETKTKQGHIKRGYVFSLFICPCLQKQNECSYLLRRRRFLVAFLATFFAAERLFVLRRFFVAFFVAFFAVDFFALLRFRVVFFSTSFFVLRRFRVVFLAAERFVVRRFLFMK